MYQRILVATDGSALSKKAVKHAIKLIAAHLYDVRRGAKVIYPEGSMAPAGDPVAARTGFAIPNRAAELLHPFLRGS